MTRNKSKWCWGKRRLPWRSTMPAGICLALLMAATASGQVPLQYHGVGLLPDWPAIRALQPALSTAGLRADRPSY
jgi:hypothetical protein